MLNSVAIDLLQTLSFGPLICVVFVRGLSFWNGILDNNLSAFRASYLWGLLLQHILNRIR